MSKEKEAYFKNLPHNERLTALRENAVKSYQKNVIRDFTEEELSDIKTTLSEQAITLNDAEIEKKELTADLTAKIKLKKAEIKTTLRDLKNKYYENEEAVFDIDDQEAGLMYTFDNQGNILSQRRLTPAERQTTIKNLTTKTA
jgi:hypothetical protein